MQTSILLLLGLACQIVDSMRSRARKRQQRGEWVVGEVPSDSPNGAPGPSTSTDLEFHGTFRDLSMWRDTTQPKQAKNSSNPLWVVEYEDMKEMETERRRAQSLGLQILFKAKGSLVIQGDVPGTLGYDACGGNNGKIVAPVSEYEVTPKAMPDFDKEKYMALASVADPANVALRGRSTRSSLKETVEKLEKYVTRNSYSGEGGGLDQAADWAAEQFVQSGFTVTRDDFRPGSWWQSRITPQIIAEFRGTENPDRVVVMGAHLDSIARNTQLAPGADDNGSGSAVILELARIIGQSGASFKNTLRLCLFTGEEQGLLGSRDLARRWKSQGVDIIAMLNADMVGYRQPGEPITLALMSRNADADLVEIVATATTTYLRDSLPVGYTTGCCSDQQAFYENGYPAMGVFETPTSRVVYPHYHQATDESQWLTFEQIELHGQAFMAAALLFAEIV